MAGSTKQRKGAKKNASNAKDLNKILEVDKEPKDMKTNENPTIVQKSPPFLFRLFIFIVLPSLVGSIGLLTAYVMNLSARASNGAKEEKEINVDRDFIYPFILTLATVSVLWYQTKGFSTQEAAPLVAWPKVKRKKKIVRRTVVVDDEEEDDDDDENTSTEEMKIVAGRRKVSRKED